MIDALPAPSLREARLLSFALNCAADNPAAIGSQRRATELLDALGIEPRENGSFFVTPEADLADAQARLTAAPGDDLDTVEAMAMRLAEASGARWDKISEPVDDERFDYESRGYWRRLARAAIALAADPAFIGRRAGV
jgi:hypothetical protein